MNQHFNHTDRSLKQSEILKLRAQLKFTRKNSQQFAILSVINFLFFTTNFEDLSFIRKIWEADGLAQHFTDKMRSVCRKYEQQGFIPAAAILDFFFLLSQANQEKFIAWVQENYHYSDNHKTFKP